MIVITFTHLYIFYGIIISFLCLSIRLAQNWNSQYLFHYLSFFCAILALYTPIFLKYHSLWTQFDNAFVSIFSAVTGFLFALKILELGFTYDWSRQQRVTSKQILIDFSTFPRHKYEPEENFPVTKSNSVNPTFGDHVRFLLLGDRDQCLSARRQNLLIAFGGLFQLFCLRVLLHLTPYSVLRLHSRQANLLYLPHFVTYVIYGFILYFSLGMVINLVFGLMGFFWNVHLRPLFPGYPFFATGLHDFWSRRWNFYVKSILHRLAFIALPKLTGHGEKSNGRLICGGLFAFFVSGLLHEFMYSVSMDRLSGGKNMLFFLIHGAFVGIEVIIQGITRQKQIVPPLIGWFYTIIAIYATGYLFCDPWIEADCFVTLKKHLG